MQAERGFQNRAEKLNVPMSTTAVFCNKSGLNCPWCACRLGTRAAGEYGRPRRCPPPIASMPETVRLPGQPSPSCSMPPPTGLCPCMARKDANPGAFRQPDGQISRGCQRGRHDPLCHPRVLAVPRNRGSRLLFRKNSAPRRGFERIESGGSAAEAAFGANRGPAARPARNSRRVLIYFSYPLPNRLLKQTSWPRMNTDEHGFEECKCFVFNPRSSAFNFGHHNHVSIENIGVTLGGPAPVF